MVIHKQGWIPDDEWGALTQEQKEKHMQSRQELFDNEATGIDYDPAWYYKEKQRKGMERLAQKEKRTPYTDAERDCIFLALIQGDNDPQAAYNIMAAQAANDPVSAALIARWQDTKAPPAYSIRNQRKEHLKDYLTLISAENMNRLNLIMKEGSEAVAAKAILRGIEHEIGMPTSRQEVTLDFKSHAEVEAEFEKNRERFAHGVWTNPPPILPEP